MDEQTPAVRNKGLLITALVLAVLVVVIYNWHVSKVRSEAEGETVRAVRARFADLAPGDVVATNDPFAGGSHLPDVTVVTPVFVEDGPPHFFVASRGHHADLGGTTPGSMPADSRTLEEEGVLFRAFPLVRAGRLDEARVRRLLTEARHPSRNPEDNLADFIDAFFLGDGEEAVLELANLLREWKGQGGGPRRELPWVRVGVILGIPLWEKSLK